MAVAASRKFMTWSSRVKYLRTESSRVRRLIAKHSSRVLDPHLVGNAGFGQAHELGERRVRPARAAG